MKNYKAWFLGMFLALCSSGAASTAWADGKSIQIKGSDTIVNLAQAWAEEYMQVSPDTSIAVTGGGSGIGIAALINGTTDIANASRPIKKKEIEDAQKAGYYPEEFRVGVDALAVIVHPANPVKELTFDQLSGIFTGTITNWKEVGGKDEKILVLSRDRNSGTHVYFLEHVVRKGNAGGPEQYAPSTLMLPSTQAIVDEVTKSDGAIGYVGFGYVSSKIKAVAVAKKSGEPFVLPSKEAAMNHTYPIWRYLYMYTGFKPRGEVKKFLDFVLSPKGQEIVEKMDFVPLSEKK